MRFGRNLASNAAFPPTELRIFNFTVHTQCADDSPGDFHYQSTGAEPAKKCGPYEAGDYRALRLPEGVAGGEFTFGTASHELVNCIARRFTFIQYGVDLFRNWHFNPMCSCEFHRRIGGEDSFRDHSVHAGDNFRQLASAAKFDTNAAITRKISRAGEDQIPQAGESRHGFCAAATGRN